MGGPLEAGGLPGPTDAWTTLAGLARETSTIRLGTLVNSATFRLPGPLAIIVAQVDEMSGGRVELGLGAGWYEQEHQAYAIPFPPLGERFDRLEEQLAVITGLWSTPVGGRFSYNGEHYQVTDSPALPKPVQDGRRADHHRRRRASARRRSRPATPPSTTRRSCRSSASSSSASAVAAACTAIDRDPASIRYTAAAVVCLGADEAEYERRAAAIGREPDELRRNGVAGTPDEVRASIQRWADAGAERLYLQVLDLADLDHLDAIAASDAERIAAIAHGQPVEARTYEFGPQRPSIPSMAAKRGPKGPMSDDHKAALAQGRSEGRAVREYLDALRANKPKRGRKRTPDSIKKRLAAIDEQLESADPLGELRLIQERRDLADRAGDDGRRGRPRHHRGRVRQGGRELQRPPGHLLRRVA